MSSSTALEIPPGGFILEKYPEGKQFQKQVMRLSLTDEDIIQEMVDPGSILKIAFGKTMKLVIGEDEYSIMAEKVSEAQQPELYQAAGNKLNFISTITHTLQIQDDADSANESEQKLRDSYDQLNQEKVVASTVLVSDYGLLPPPRNARQFGSLKKASYLKKNRKTVGATGSGPTTPGQIGRSPASMAQSTVESRELQKALRIPMVHLLALGPLTAKSLAIKTRAPIELVEKVLPKIAKIDITGRQWILLDDAYKELDVWDFPYMNADDREKAIKNAKEAFKRQHLASREEAWFMLVEPDKRDEAKRNAISVTPVMSDKEAAERAISLPPPIDASKLAKQAAKPQKAAKPAKQSNLMSRLKAGGKITAPKAKKNPPASTTAAATPAAAPKAKGTVGRPPKNPAAPKTTKANAKSTAANNSKIKSAEIITDSDEEADMEDSVVLAPPKPAPTKPSPAPRVTHALPPKPVVSAVPTKQLADAPRLSPKRKTLASKEQPVNKSPAKKAKTLAHSPEPPVKREPTNSKKVSRERAYSPEVVQKSRAPPPDYSPEPVKSRSYGGEQTSEPTRKKNRVPLPPVGTPEHLKRQQYNAASPERPKSLTNARDLSPEPVRKRNRVPLPPVGSPEPIRKVYDRSAYSPEPVRKAQQSAAYSPEAAKIRRDYRVRDRSPEPTRRSRDRSLEPVRRGRDRSPEPSRRSDRSLEPVRRRSRDRSPEPVRRSVNASRPRDRSREPVRRQESLDRTVKRDAYKISPASEKNGYTNKTSNKTLPRPSSQRSDNSLDHKRTPSDRTPIDSRSPSYRGSTDSQSPRDSLNGRTIIDSQPPRYSSVAVNGAKRRGDRDRDELVVSSKSGRSASSSEYSSQKDRDGNERILKRRPDNANGDNERPSKKRSVSPPSSKKQSPSPLPIGEVDRSLLAKAKRFKDEYQLLKDFHKRASQLPAGSREQQALVAKVMDLTEDLGAMKAEVWRKSDRELARLQQQQQASGSSSSAAKMGRTDAVKAR
ncbi:hypothetical protein BZA77DRAFT_173353 [Pyronema omphalodes]|nr:hypothetical protein BZA77DRAFT_173353 [Pyronema omphalodes]